MDHRTLVASLTRGERAELLGRSDRPGLRQLALHAGALLLTGTLIGLAVPIWPVLIVVSGILLVFLFTPLHETIHETAFRSVWLNRVVASVCGFLLLLPPRWFRYFHFAHHRHTHDPARDPELATPKPERLRAYLLHLSGLPVWRSQIRTLLANACGRCRDGFVPERARAGVHREARLFLLGYAVLAVVSIALRSDLLVWLWLLPLAVGQPFLRAYLLAEHTRCPQVANMLANSRTTFTTALVRLIAWNMPYHAEHHALPAVPFHKLPAFHRIVREHLRETASGYVAFHRALVRSLGGTQTALRPRSPQSSRARRPRL